MQTVKFQCLTFRTFPYHNIFQGYSKTEILCLKPHQQDFKTRKVVKIICWRAVFFHWRIRFRVKGPQNSWQLFTVPKRGIRSKEIIIMGGRWSLLYLGGVSLKLFCFLAPDILSSSNMYVKVILFCFELFY